MWSFFAEKCPFFKLESAFLFEKKAFYVEEKQCALFIEKALFFSEKGCPPVAAPAWYLVLVGSLRL